MPQTSENHADIGTKLLAHLGEFSRLAAQSEHYLSIIQQRMYSVLPYPLIHVRVLMYTYMLYNVHHFHT